MERWGTLEEQVNLVPAHALLPEQKMQLLTLVRAASAPPPGAMLSIGQGHGDNVTLSWMRGTAEFTLFVPPPRPDTRKCLDLPWALHWPSGNTSHANWFVVRGSWALLIHAATLFVQGTAIPGREGPFSTAIHR